MYPKETRWECSASYPDVEHVGVAAMLYVSRQQHACAPPLQYTAKNTMKALPVGI